MASFAMPRRFDSCEDYYTVNLLYYLRFTALRGQVSISIYFGPEYSNNIHMSPIKLLN